MTEETPKLDVKTLEYMLSVVDKKVDKYEGRRNFWKKEGEKIKAEKSHSQWCSMIRLKDEIKALIREQQEA